MYHRIRYSERERIKDDEYSDEIFFSGVTFHFEDHLFFFFTVVYFSLFMTCDVTLLYLSLSLSLPLSLLPLIKNNPCIKITQHNLSMIESSLSHCTVTFSFPSYTAITKGVINLFKWRETHYIKNPSYTDATLSLSLSLSFLLWYYFIQYTFTQPEWYPFITIE